MPRDEVIALLLEIAKTSNETLGSQIDISAGEQALLFGPDGGLDSIGLVSFLVDVEEALQRHFALTTTLADERAMSLRRSPFRSIGTLADYIVAVSVEGA